MCLYWGLMVDAGLKRVIFCVVGTRAQLIKMAPVMQALEAKRAPYRLIFTGQHKATMGELLDEFAITTSPEYLYAGPEISGIGGMLWWVPLILFRLIRRYRQIMLSFPEGRALVLVHGDTFSTLIGALAGRLCRSRVVHIESGLRSFNWLHPFPEELTRLAVFRLSDVAMCPGGWAMRNMEGRSLTRVDTKENTLLDAVRYALSAENAIPTSRRRVYCVASIHRFENIFRRSRLTRIVELLELVSERCPVVFVLHPATEKRLGKYALRERISGNPRIELVPRMTYIPFVQLIAKANFVVTDGGSNQEELSYFGIPTLLMRAATERREGLGDTVTIANYDVDAVRAFLKRQQDDGRFADRCIDSDIQPSRYIVERLLGD